MLKQVQHDRRVFRFMAPGFFRLRPDSILTHRMWGYDPAKGGQAHRKGHIEKACLSHSFSNKTNMVYS
jgi:hypothetical protein